MFPLIIGIYTLENFKEAEAEAEDLNGFFFADLRFWKYDLNGISSTHYKEIGFGWSYAHFKYGDEDKIKNFYNDSKEIGQNEQQGKKGE